VVSVSEAAPFLFVLKNSKHSPYLVLTKADKGIMRSKKYFLTLSLLLTGLLGQNVAHSEETAHQSLVFPFDFSTSVDAKTGDFVLVPSNKTIAKSAGLDPAKIRLIWYTHTMEKPGPEKSMVKFKFEKQAIETPNPYIVPIHKGATAKKGDILLTWWQSGSGMQRAIVVDDKNPKEPVVRYLDIAYDNPSKSRDKTTTIGKMDEKLKPDSFVVIKDELEPGTSVSIKEKNKELHAQVIRSSNDKVFVKMFGGKVAVFPKSIITPVPIKPSLKAGDSVKAVRYGSFSAATVTKIDEKIGRVWVQYSTGAKKEKVVSIGDILPG
jgi:hypothetical protein